MDARCIVTTPNADVIYAMSYLDLKKDGPLVVAAPPGILGMFTDFWQRQAGTPASSQGNQSAWRESNRLLSQEHTLVG
jgi:hypothetical protein